MWRCLCERTDRLTFWLCCLSLQLKTLVSLMHRKYSLENLRIGQEASSLPTTTLFPDLGSE